jgi:hypothetical protein
LQQDLDRLGEWAAENEMKIKPSKFTAVRFTRARVKGPLNYTLGDQLIPEANSWKYLGVILRRDLNWADHVNYTMKKVWKALHFIMRILKNGNSNTKSLTYVYVTSRSDSGIWGRVMRSIQGGTNNCFRQGAKESGQICISYEQFELGNFDVA